MSAKWTRKPNMDGWYIMSFTGMRDDYATAIFVRDGKYNYVGNDIETSYDLTEKADGHNIFYGPITFPKKKVAA